MEKFRELEKDYKQRKLTKSVFKNNSETGCKYRFDSGEDNDSSEERKSGNQSNSDEELRSEDNENNSGESHGSEQEAAQQDSDDSEGASDKEWCNFFLVDSLKKIAQSVELSISQLRPNKNKGSMKKNREKISQFEQRMASINSIISKLNEVQTMLDLLDSKRLRRLRHIASAYIRTNGEETDSQ